MVNLMTACQPCNLIKGKRLFGSLEVAKKYALAKRQECRKQYDEQMSQVGKAA